MRRFLTQKGTRRFLFAALAIVLVWGTVASSTVQAASYTASYIKEMTGKLKTNFESYLDSSVMYKLPETIRDDQEISVIIKLDEADILSAYEKTDKSMSFAEFALTSEKAASIRTQIRSEKARVLAALEQQGISYTLGEDYANVLSGFELLITASDFEATCKSLPAGAEAIISEAYKVAQTQLVENAVNVYSTGIFDSSNVPYDGSGMVVAVLDTGLDYTHSAFSTDNFTSTNLGMTFDDVSAAIGSSTAATLFGGLTASDVYISDKVPFGFDYADKDPDPYSTHNNHGTHVSGVILGKDDTITGVAPNAQLVSMKIFSDIQDTAMASWILSALEDCVVLGVDVINMSLGTACGFSRESDEEALNGVYDKLRKTGISIIVAASNSYSSAYGSEANGNLGLTSNPDTGTVGSPGTYDCTMSVASINGAETPYIKYKDTIIYFDEANNNAAEELDFFNTLLGDQDTREIEFVVVPGVGRSADYTGLDVNGKIALVRRGSNTFEEKALIAEGQGAAGIIIYNNVSGDIKMNVGDAKLAVCSISQDDGELLAALGKGTILLSKEQSSGPFMSDFSSWGPTPDLKIKPEITAHGGKILSSVTGGGYDRLSGTSMACPNLAGVVVLLRQYVVENFPEIANDPLAVNTMVNRLMMSTADIVLNTNGLPYAVRKQGAGLANLASSIATTAYITTYDLQGNTVDKTKLELGDDPSKTGVYTMKFTVTNFGDSDLTYTLGCYVMTEGVSDIKTNSGKTTVTEEGYLLEGAKVEFTGADKGGKLTVAAGSSVDVTATVTLSDSDKKYLDESFENGMYVEGFLTLTASKGTEVDLSIPYLAYYGDWTQAPMFDLTYFDTNADELDEGIDPEDKTMADAYATRAIGGVYDDYVSYLGTYYFLQDPDDMVISASKDYIALSNQDGTIHSLRFVWAGLLRSAQRIEVEITDDTTGEVIFECVDEDVRKSYGDGGSIYPANIEIEFDTKDYNLTNNSQYTVTLTGYMDYGDGGLTTNKNNTFSFPLTVDFEAPTVEGVEYYYEYDQSLKKNRLYAKVAVFDNHHAMALQLGYITESTDENGQPAMELKSFEQYMTPVYSQRNSTTYVTVELTDYLFTIKDHAANPNSFVLTSYDYALNYATYEIGLPDNFTDFYMEGLEGELRISVNQVHTLEPSVYPTEGWGELLEFTSSKPSVVRVVNNKLVGVAPGTANIKVRDPKTNSSTIFKVTVLGEGDEGYVRYDKPVADIFTLDGYKTLKAYYILDNDEKKIGDTGDVRFFEGNYGLTLYPSESVQLNHTLAAFFPKDTEVVYESSNENIVTIDASGKVVAQAEGFASVTIKLLMDGKSTYYSESVTVEVQDPYINTGASLTHYYGKGGVVTVPEDLSLTEIGNFAFSNFEYILKTPEELALDDRETSKAWFIGDNTITKVILPEGIKKINAYAFANLTALEEIVLPSTLESIEYGAFYGCTALEKLNFSGENNVVIINQNAFENCNLQGTLEFPKASVISNYAFAGNKELKGIVLSESLRSIGQYAFAGCAKLETVTIPAKQVKYGDYAFTGCKTLKEFTVASSVIPAGMFYECEKLTSVTLGAEVASIGEFAFRDTAVESFIIAQGNTTYKVQTAKYILSADGTTLMAVSPKFQGDFTAADIGNAAVTAIGRGAFSHATRLTSVALPKVTRIADYGFASVTRLKSVTLGKLTEVGSYAFFESPIAQMPQLDDAAKLGSYAFSHTAVTAVSIPDGMEIPEGAFSECSKLETVVIGDNVTLGKYAFNYNKDLGFKVKSRNENGDKHFYYEFTSPMTSLTIGKNAVIGDNAFGGAACLERVTLGEGAKIGYMAFYNNSSLKQIDLSKAVSIGDYAFSGDVYYACLDDSMTVAAVSKEGKYLYTYHAPMLETVDLSAATELGEYAFAYCRQMTGIRLPAAITEIRPYTFAGCDALENVNLEYVTTIGDYGFVECGLKEVDLSTVTKIGEFAFTYCMELTGVTFNPAGVSMGEGAFAYCDKLAAPENLNACTELGDYAFAYTAITEADLSGAVTLGNHVFLKEELTPFKVTLGDKLTSLGDNPFAMCLVAPFSISQTESFNGKDYTTYLYTYNISDSVRVIDGSLYCKVPGGLELITYAGIDHVNARVADGTVRITALAFAGSDVQNITLPYTVTSIGHKAFYLCGKLDTVIFNSYTAPILEEEFDLAYYETYEHIPGTGDYGTYTDYDGNEVQINGAGILPWFMWNVTDNMYSNVFYGANFVDYVGYVENKLTMVRPINGQNYDTYILQHYFDRVINGAAAADDVTLAAIKAIQAIPERTVYEDKHLVEAARAAYTKIATTEQQALVHNYADLISAEQRILALTPTDAPTEEPGTEQEKNPALLWIAIIALVLLCIAPIVLLALKNAPAPKAKAATETPAADPQPQQADAAPAEQAEQP